MFNDIFNHSCLCYYVLFVMLMIVFVVYFSVLSQCNAVLLAFFPTDLSFCKMSLSFDFEAPFNSLLEKCRKNA